MANDNSETSSDDASASSDNSNHMMFVEVAYALPDKQIIIPLQIDQAATVTQAITASGILEQFPDIDLNINSVGIFSKKAKLDQLLQEKDRVEIYRPLLADPKEVRRRRAAEGKAMRKGGGDKVSEK